VGRHVDTVLRRNLPNFLGLDEVSFWVEDWALKASPQMAARVTGEPAARVLLTRVLRALTRELVPIRDADAILRALAESWPGTVELRALMRAVRLRLREALPGQERPRVAAPPWLLAGLEPHVAGPGETTSCTFQREHAMSLLDRVEQWLRDEGIELVDVVLVAPTADIRLFVSRLLSTRFPMVAVLSEEELVGREEGVVDPEGAVVGAAAEGADR
jgi:flagellar biosynthesis component FlhA